MMHIIDQLVPTEKTQGLCGLIVNETAKKSCEERFGSTVGLEILH